MTRSQTALIAGGGLAGLAAAIFLDELGYQITLIEKKPILGGRTYSFVDKVTGCEVDNGQHLLIGAYHETLKLLERVGAKHKVAFFTPPNITLVNEQGTRALLKMKSLPAPWGLLLGMLSFRHFSFCDKIKFLKLGFALKQFQNGKKPIPKNISVQDWLRSLGQSENAMKNFWDILTLATLNDTPDKASADGLITVLIRSFLSGQKDGHLIFCKSGLSSTLTEPILKYLQWRGHTVQTGVGLKEIKILDGRVQNFIFHDGTQHKADLYVSAIPANRLLPTLPRAFLSTQPQLEACEDFIHSPIISINLFFDRAVMTDAFVGASANRIHWFFNRNLMIKTNSKHHHVMGVISGAYADVETKKEILIAQALNDLSALYPAVKTATLTHALVNCERQATLSCRVGVNAKRPQQKVLDNFFILGDWTQTGLPPTIESAIISAKLMIQNLQK